MHSLLRLLVTLAVASALVAQDAPSDPARDREMRTRYESVLLKNPFQDRAFNSVYEGYAKVEGVDAWITALKPKADAAGDDQLPALLLLGQVYDRQFKMPEAIAALEKAAEKGESRPQFKVLLGTLYYKSGRDDPAGKLLGEALDTLTDLEQRGSVSRLLGNLYLRQGKRDQAVAVWKRIAEQNPEDTFAQQELAEIYEDNRMWDQAIEVYRGIVERAKDDPYRRCRALRSIGQCQVQAERFKEAMGTYEQALELVSPGNWLFEDLKLRLVGVYEDIGDLAGLAKYVEARLQQNANDVEFRDLLAETHTRMGRFDDAEKEYRQILERNPRNTSTYEKLIALHARTGNKAEVAASFEKLIELFPTDTEYLRRLGEFHLHDQQPEKAKETWRRLVKDGPTPEKLATLAGWFESYEFPDEAIATYVQALEKKKDKEWTLRLATLRFQKGEEADAVKLWLGVITPESKIEDYTEVAGILEANNKTDEAAKLRLAAVEKDPKNLEARLAYAKLLAKQQKWEDSLVHWEPLATQAENEFLQQQGEQGRIDAWREMGVLEEKQKALEAEVAKDPTDGKKLGQLARLMERGGQREKAIQLYEGRREKEPENVEHLRALSKLYAGAKQTDQAIATYKALLDQDKPRARVYQKELLELYLGVDLKEEAIAAGEAYVSQAPGDPEAHLTLAQVYQMYRQPEKAFGEYRTALRLEANEPDYWRQYGAALEEEKRYGEAQEAFRKMLDTSKEDTTRMGAVANLARIHLQQDRLNELVAEFQRRIRNTPKKLAAYEELAAIYKESGQIVRGVEVLESGLQTVDDKAAALKALIRATYEAQDFPKVRSYYEQLVGMSGKPTANEFEKLGQIYAELGEVEKAREAWNKIIVTAPKDPKAHDRVAKLFQEKGFTDEAMAVKARAVELDPSDYKRRYEYAQQLAQGQQPVQAMEQVRLLLEIGDREETAKKEKESEKKVKAVQKGQTGPGTVSPYQFMYGGRSYGGYWGGGWQGGFQQFRPAVLQFMAGLAQQSIGEDAFIEQMQARAKKAGASAEAKQDLLAILRMFNRMEEALKVGEELLAGSPDSPDLLMTVALLESDQGLVDKAITLLERLAQSQPKRRVQAASGLVPLYFKNKQDDKAVALIGQLLQENPTDINTYYAMSSMLQQNGKYDEARKILSKLAEVDPLQAGSVRNQLAGLAKQSGKPEEAFVLLRQQLFEESKSTYAFYNRSRRVEIYVPEPNQNRGNYGNPLQNLPPTALGGFSWEKSSAFGELSLAAKAGTDKGTNVFELMGRAARGWASATTPSQRDQAWEMTRLLIAHHTIEKEFDQATNLLAAIHQAGFDDASWYNASLYVAQQREDFDGMIRLYDELLKHYPAKGRDIAIAKANTLLIAKRYEDVGRMVRELNQQRVPPAQVLGLIGTLQRVGEKKLAKQLLEEHLAGISRNPQALSMLASLHGEENDFEKAIALANEAWERKAHGNVGGGGYYYGGYGYYMPSFGGVDNLLNELHRYYVGAGRSEELIARFQQALEKQPASVQAHENLASLYRFSDQKEKAIELYQQLLEKRPHLMQARRQIAGLYQEMGQFDKATKLYEDLIKANPNLYNQFQWELRWAYQRQGKGKELAQMEKNIADKARDPNQLSQLAWRAREDGDLDKAIELLRKAAKMAPAQGNFQSQLAAIFMEKGQLEEALQNYEQWFNSPQLRAQGYTDHYTLRQFAGLYKANGRLDDLKQRCEVDLQKNPGDRNARALQAHIAFLEKRFDDALAGFKKMIETAPDGNLVGQLIELAGFSGKFQDVLEVAEKADQRGSAWDAQQLAQLYIAVGDRKKAVAQQLKWAEQMLQQGNGGYATRETVEAFARMDLWDDAEAFVNKHRTDTMQQWEQEEFDRMVAERYVRERRFEPLVKSVLAKDSLKGRDLDLVKKIVEQYQWNNRGNERRLFLERIVSADPKNRELAASLLPLYDRPEDLPRKLALAQQLTEQDPSNLQYRRAWTEAMIDLGRVDEGVKGLTEWATAKPGEQRWSLLSEMNTRAGRPKEARAALVKAAETADKTRQSEVRLQLASFDTQHGDPAGEHDALRANFEQKKDTQSFQRFYQFLNNVGWEAEAHALFATNRDSGFFEQYQNTDFVTLCLNQSDLASPADLNWRFTRYGERWNRDYYYDRVAKLYRDRGKLNWFATDFERRVREDAATNQGLLDRVARGWESAGYPEKALEIYDRQLQQSPFNLTAAQRKAELLIKQGRADDALEMLRQPKGITSLDAEAGAQLQLIRTLYKLGRREEAAKVSDALRAWDKRPGTLQQLAGILMEQRDYAVAAEFLEKASSGIRDWNYEELLGSLAKCRAKLGKTDDLVKLVNDLAQSMNADYRLNELQSWLTTEGFHELALRVIEARLGRAPDDFQLLVARAASQAAAGHTNEFFAACEAAAKALPVERHGELQQRLSGLLSEHSLVETALNRPELPGSPALTGALIALLANGDEKAELTKRLADSSGKLRPADSETQVVLGDALARLKRDEAAAGWFRSALTATNESTRVTAALGLCRVSTNNLAAISILVDLLKTKPQAFINSDAHVVAVARSGNATLIDQLARVLADAALHEGERAFSAMLLTYHRGQTNEARAALAALAAAPKLTTSQLQTVASLCKETGQETERVQALARLARGGYSGPARQTALTELVETHIRASDFSRAVAALSEAYSSWGMQQCIKAQNALADAINADNYPAFRKAVIEDAAAHPEADAASTLIGFGAQVGQRLGRDDTAGKLAGEARLSTIERDEAQAWDSFIERWELAGPVRSGSGPGTGFAYGGSPGGSSSRTEPTLSGDLKWKPTDPKRCLGMIRPDEVLGLTPAEGSGASIYARTGITSPEERRVTFCLGSDDWIRVWVNGELAHEWGEGRSLFPDQDRFTVTLKKGENRVLVQLGNLGDAWGFCLRVAEGGDGLVLASAK